MELEQAGLAQINAALDTVHNPTSASAARHEAQAFLETLRGREDAAFIGWRLNTEPMPGSASNGYVRHFGLALLDSSITTQFPGFDEAKRLAIRDWIIQLAFLVQDKDPYYIREKVAYLWVSIAKRVWGLDTRVNPDADDVAPSDGWVNMDAQLLELWHGGLAHRELSLSILRSLFEDIYLLDDPVATKRLSTLSSQAIEIVVSQADIAEIYSARSSHLEKLRANSNENEGWLGRWTAAVRDVEDPKFLLHLLETIKSTLRWLPVTSIMSSNILEVLVTAIKHSDVNIRIVACDSLHILFNMRAYNDPADFERTVGTVFETPGIQWLSEVYSSVYQRTAEVEDADDDLEYVFTKKFVELIVTLGDFIINVKAHPLPSTSDFPSYFQLMLEISKHPSLMVSGLVLQFWCSVLRLEKLAEKPYVEATFPALLQVASDRCINYQHMPEDNLTRQYMRLDFDSQPDSVQFYKNYQRYMEDILRLMVCRIPMAGMQFLHSRMVDYFQTENGWKTMNAELKSHEDPAFILGSAQFTIVESAIRGVSRWQIWASPEERHEMNEQVLGYMASWAQEMLELRTTDLVMQRKTVECLVQFAPLLKDNDQLLFKILERVLESCTYDFPPETPEFDDQREKVNELRAASGTELNRLAYMVPGALAKIYDALENVVANLIVTKDIKEHESVSFKSFLLVASQRSSMPNKAEKFSAIVDPVLARWTDETTMKGLADLEWFMERVGVVQIDQYFRQRGITAQTNLLEAPMDDAGRALKAELKQKWQAIFPIRPSRIFIQYTIERLDHQSPEYLYLLSMWKPRVQPILPHILQLIAQIMAYHNPANWTNLPPEVQTFVRSSITERFWHMGISMQTRDEFESANQAATRTLRDFADSVGHIVRYTREYAFLTLGSITQLEETMFELPGMGRMLYQALASTTEGISSHAWRHMLSLVVRNAVKNCPTQYVEPFFREFLPPFLHSLDGVLVHMWEKQAAAGFKMDESSNDEELSEEMMEEHLLRQLTAIVDRLLIDLVGQATMKTDPREYTNENGELTQKAQVRQVCRNTPEILIEVLRLSKHIMSFKDNRCVYNTCLIVRHLLAGPPIEIMDEVASVFIVEIMPACLAVLSDQDFWESHLEAGTILTLIYSQLPSTQPSPIQELVSLLPGIAAAPDRVKEFEVAMAESKSLRQQRGVFMDFLAQCRVLEVDDQSRSRNRKRVEQHRVSIRHQQQDEQYDAEAIISMFGGN